MFLEQAGCYLHTLQKAIVAVWMEENSIALIRKKLTLFIVLTLFGLVIFNKISLIVFAFVLKVWAWDNCKQEIRNLLMLLL